MSRGRSLSLAALWAASQAACYFFVDTTGIVGGPATPGSDGGPVDAAPEGGTETDDDASLLGYWSFDEQTPNGVVSDLSDHGHDGQLGTPALLSPGRVGNALATAMTVESLSGEHFPRQGTLSFWLRADFDGSEVDGLNIFDSYDTSRSHIFVRVPNDSSLYLQMACQTAGRGQYPFGAELERPASNTWMHLVFTWDSVGHTAAVYINGKSQAGTVESTLASWSPSDQKFVFASTLRSGLIDEARIYSRVFSATEVTKIP